MIMHENLNNEYLTIQSICYFYYLHNVTFLSSISFIFQRMREIDENQRPLFDKTAPLHLRQVYNDGTIECLGPMSSGCDKFHSIDFYSSSESREQIGHWEIDHTVEVVKIAKGMVDQYHKMNKEEEEIDFALIYSLLFSTNWCRAMYYKCHRLSQPKDHLELDFPLTKKISKKIKLDN